MYEILTRSCLFASFEAWIAKVENADWDHLGHMAQTLHRLTY